MDTLTDRYVAATVRELTQDQRDDVDRELRGTIEDMVEARLDAGAAASREEAEREVLVELGDPIRLAAGLHGAARCTSSDRACTRSGAASSPSSSRSSCRSRPSAPSSSGSSSTTSRPWGSARRSGPRPSPGSTLRCTSPSGPRSSSRSSSGRSRTKEVMGWTPEQLPEAADTRRTVSRTETVGGLVTLLVVVLAVVWQQVSSPVRLRGGERPRARPRPLVELAAGAPRARRRPRSSCSSWRTGPGAGRGARAGVGALVDVASAALLVWLLQTDRFLDGRFLEALVGGGWATAGRDLTVGLTLGVVVVTLWDQVETVRRLRAR